MLQGDLLEEDEENLEAEEQDDRYSFQRNGAGTELESSAQSRWMRSDSCVRCRLAREIGASAAAPAKAAGGGKSDVAGKPGALFVSWHFVSASADRGVRVCVSAGLPAPSRTNVVSARLGQKMLLG